MYSKSVFTYLFAFVFTALCFGQINNKDSILTKDEQNTPSPKLKGQISSNAAAAVNTIIKLQSLLLFRGIIGIQLEQKIQNNLTGQITIGYRFKSDIMNYDFIDYDISKALSEQNKVHPWELLYNQKCQANAGYFFNLGGRVYFTPVVFNDYYIEFRLASAKRNYLFKEGNVSLGKGISGKSLVFFNEDINYKTTTNTFAINFGTQFVSKGSFKLCQDVFVGIAIGQFQFNNLSYELDDLIEEKVNVYKAAGNSRFTSIQFNLGYAVGFGF
jgi:hypothetical protein